MPTWLDITIRLLTALAALTAAGVAVIGLRAWKAQLRGKTEYDLARRVLRAVLEVRQQIASVRRSFVSPSEMIEALKDAGVDPKGVDITSDDRVNDYVYDRRWKPLSRALTDLSAEVVEAEVLWGPDVRAAERELQRCVGELNVAIRIYFRDLKADHRDPIAARERIERHFAVVYDQSDEKLLDEFATRVVDVVAAFERLLRPHLRLTT